MRIFIVLHTIHTYIILIIIYQNFTRNQNYFITIHNRRLHKDNRHLHKVALNNNLNKINVNRCQRCWSIFQYKYWRSNNTILIWWNRFVYNSIATLKQPSYLIGSRSLPIRVLCVIDIWRAKMCGKFLVFSFYFYKEIVPNESVWRKL